MTRVSSTILNANGSNPKKHATGTRTNPDAELFAMIKDCAALHREAGRLADSRPGSVAFDKYDAVCRDEVELEEQIKLPGVHSERAFKAKCEALNQEWIELDFLTAFQLGRDAGRLGLTDVVPDCIKASRR